MINNNNKEQVFAFRDWNFYEGKFKISFFPY